jgi:hypothetical protein
MVEPWLILECHCPHCKKSLHFGILPVAAMPESQPPRPRLHRPS